MDCKNIQELILTDYLDGEMSEDQHNEITQHLHNCTQCSQFVQTIKQTAVNPFKRAKLIDPPASVWLGIQKSIEQRHAHGWFWDFFTFKKPVFAAAALTVVIAVVVLTLTRIPFTDTQFNGVQPAVTYFEEEMSFLSELEIDGAGYTDEDEVDFGTVIEELLM